MNVDPKGRTLKSTADNVLIVLLDGTGSMGSWRSEIWARVKVLYDEAKALLGDNLQILFGTFGDLKFRDRFEIANFAAGPDLDDCLSALSIDFGGGGDEEESPEIPAYYLLKNVDVSTAKNVYAYFITDEKAAERLDRGLVLRTLGLELDPELGHTADVFRALLRKMEVFLVLRRTVNYGYDPERIRKFWERTITKERILPLDDGRRIVDTMLAAVAKTTNQMDSFQASYMVRNKGSQYADENWGTVQKSVALVGSGAPTPPPSAKKSRLLDALLNDKDE